MTDKMDDRTPPRAVVVPPGQSTVHSGAADIPLIGVGGQLVRVAAVSSWRAAVWSVGAAATGTAVVLKRATSGAPAPVVLQGIGTDLRAAVWHALGIPDSTDEHGVPESVAPVSATVADLRSRGEDLMRRSNDVRVTEDTHPAFARILTEITPDEARVLRFLYVEGPQPAIDIRTNRPFGVGSELIGNGLNMIAEHAGCRNVDRIHPYLTNLSRLGLLEFSKEPVSNPQRYQLIEAQPKVTEVLQRAGRWPRIVQRSIHLNNFGEEFCRTCLPLTMHRTPNGRPAASRPTESG